MLINNSIPVEKIEIQTHTGWLELDRHLLAIISSYCSKVDPEFGLGITAENNLVSYQIGEIFRNLEKSQNSMGFCQKQVDLPELLPYGYLIGDVESISCNFEPVSFDFSAIRSLIPKAFLQRYTSVLLENQAAIITGTEKSGKTHVSREIANYLSKGKLENVIELDATKQKFSDFVGILKNSLSLNSGVTVVLVSALESFDNGNFTDVECAFKQIFQICQNVSSTVFVIGTLKTQSLDSEIRASNPIFSSSIKTINLNNTAQPACGLLARFIKREFDDSDMPVSVELTSFMKFLPKFVVQLNRMLEEISGSSCATIGAGLFIGQVVSRENPVDSFVKIWNSRVKQYVEKVLSLRSSFRQEWSSLLNFEKSELNFEIISKLDKILIDDDVADEIVDQNLEDLGNEFSVGKLLDDDEDIFEGLDSADPLADMLTKLQDAVKGTNCYDSESEESSIGCYTASPTTNEFVNFSLDDVNF